jgi:YidC/Oxa1 family membrane protein insertase
LAEFKNPQQEPGTERRLLLVFALTFLVIMLFQTVMKKYGPPPPEPKPETTQAQNAQTRQGQAQSAPAPAPASVASPTPAVVPAKKASDESETVIENDLYRIVFTNRGGQVKSWVLKKYKDHPDGNPLDLVNKPAAEKYGYPLSLWLYDEGLRNKVNSALYVQSENQSAQVDDATPKITVAAKGLEPGSRTLRVPAQITFEYSDGDIAVHKTFKFDHSYVVDVETSVQQKGSVVTAFPMWPEGFGDQTTGAAYATSQIAFQYNSKVERLSTGWSLFPSIKIVGGNTIPGPFHWAGASDQYFAAVFIPQDPQNTAMVTLRSPLEIRHNPSDAKNTQIDKVDVFGVAVGNLKGASNARLYVGPKALGDLEQVQVPGITGVDPDLRSIVDFGWLGLIARPLFLWLKWTHDHLVGNWGWALIIQTLIINLALLPLRVSQMKSMLKMQRIAPQIKAIQEKYKKYGLRDPRKAEMNVEVSTLYKKEGVNPAGGCLPLLIQMPFLFAYYRMLGVAIDLRHASWGWVHDLSAPDPFYILPVAIVVTMFFMQRLTPQGGMDPAQQKMMNFFMPVMLGYISLNLAAGLCLYWSMGNLISIVQQSVMNRTALGREMREMMEKRARKKDK